MNDVQFSRAQNLWLTVIEHALYEAMLCNQQFDARRKPQSLRRLSVLEARQWLVGGSHHFRTVCELADVSSDWLRIHVGKLDKRKRRRKARK